MIRWIRRRTLPILLQDIHKGRGEVAKSALIRAVFADRLTERPGVKQGRDGPYLAGPFSTMDGSMQTGLPELLEQVNVSKEVKEAILHRSGYLGEILAFIEDYESENLEALPAYLQQKGLARRGILPVFLQAVRYAGQMFDLRADAQLASPAALIKQI